MDAREPTADRPSYEDLEREVRELRAEVARLKKLLEEALRAGKRQAAPFRKEEPSGPLGKARRREKLKPGRKPGEEHGVHRRREEPDAEPDEVHRATLPACCPRCDSKRLEATEVVTQTQVELPQKPIVRRFEIEVGKCRSCGKRAPGRHELQTSDAVGAARHQLGPRMHAANERLARFLREHAEQLFTFLRPDRLGEVEATNWRAEQAIRPAVVNRKVWGGNRTQHGAHAQATLSTVLVTLAQQALDPLGWLAHARRSLEPLPLTG